MRRRFAKPENPNWHEYAHLPVPSEYPAVKSWAQPGEVMYPGLGVIDWQVYLNTVWQPNRRERVREATRTLILTNRRIIVIDEARMQKTDLSLQELEDVSVGSPPGSPEDAVGEAIVQVVFHAGPERRVVGWATRAEDANVFAEMLRELVAAVGGRTSASPELLPPPRTGYTLPMWEVDEVLMAPAAPLDDGLKFGESLIPWSDIERAGVPKPGHIVFTFRANSESASLFSGFGIRVPELGEAEEAWREFVTGREVPLS